MRTSRWLRNRLIGTTRRALEPWRRLREEQRPAVVTLAEVQRRLELLLGAMFGQAMRVVANGTAGVGPGDVVLPASLPGSDDAREEYRLLAIQQGMRIIRGSRIAAPRDEMERDIFTIVEGASVDAELIARAPGLAPVVARLRREELERRPGLQRQAGRQRDVELLLRTLLASDAGASVAGVPRTSSASESALVARDMADDMRRSTQTRIAYRAINAVGIWDSTAASGRFAQQELASLTDFQVAKLHHARSSEGDDGQTQSDDGESEMDSAEGASASDATAEGGTSAQSTNEHSDDAPFVAGGIRYPEWLARHHRLEPNHATVRTSTAPEGDDTWARHELDAHAPLVRQIRARFEMLRAQRVRLRSQRSGDELDLDACVYALTDLLTGRVPTDRLYQETRESRHSLAIAILVDASGSTRTELPDGRRVIDIERLSVLLAREAIEALGDPYAILAFSGLGRHHVNVVTVKGFAEGDSRAVLRRISSLEPDENTRLGAAVRHATALLAAQVARHRVLLILSDGRPNDVDRYQGSDAVEDARQALLAARASGVHGFCLTVDAEESEYLPHLFGEGGYQIIRDPVQLPAALVRMVGRLVRS